ncbi:cytokinin riboside 5'-monophosphate phosphoribohydrolase [Microbacterium faecale]|uniref:Cytokinin riboside 5'-monophosphate phosphoribohydrolase n=1 Tax=Microbacterium faecale TaxID=1804630 RepID=A0A916Y1S3_9MICO|nr:TIGR00730 family Rossman fold protein [Microbacterium faecale]GGD26512.1 cytokinin riboside 5'-monophosphate phosphoribohydrolase [Microbacterium faecale]
MREISCVTVFTGSSPGAEPAFADAAVAVGTALAKAGIGLVYGGGNVGLMGAVATAGRDAGGAVVGVLPEALVDKEMAHPDLTRLEIVADMHERKQRMADLSDAFVMLPGGIGTLEEFFEAWTWQQLGIHDKPIALYDVGGFWDPLLEMIDRLADQGFVREHFRNGLIVSSEPQDLLEKLRAWQRPAPKWEPTAGIV